jgi:hypothetical protein
LGGKEAQTMKQKRQVETAEIGTAESVMEQRGGGRRMEKAKKK